MEQSGFLVPRSVDFVISENNFVEMTLPYQSSANDLQVILNKDAKTDTRYYNGFLLKTKNGDIRRIVNYTGKTRICTLDRPLLSGKDEGDIVYLHGNTNICLYYDENNSKFNIKKSNNRYFLDDENSELINLCVGNLDVNNTGISTIKGNLHIGESLDVKKSITINDSLKVENQIKTNLLDIGETTSIRENTISVGHYNLSNELNAFCLTQNENIKMKIETDGNISIHADLLKLGKNTCIVNDCTTGVLGISGDKYHKNNINIFGNGHIQMRSQNTIQILANTTNIESDCNVFGNMNISQDTKIDGALDIKGLTKANDLLVDGEFYCKSLIKNPEIKELSCKNGEVIDIENVEVLAFNNSRLLTFSIDVLPKSDEVVELIFEIPDREMNFTNKRGIICYVNGYSHENEDILPILSVIGHSIQDTLKARVKFTANSDAIHTLYILCKYNK